jgi:hypothetical protein
MKRSLVALTVVATLVPATVALASAPLFKPGSYVSSGASYPRVIFSAGKTKITSLRVTAPVGACTGPFAANLASFNTGVEGTGTIKKNGTFSITLSRLAGAVTGVATGRLHNRTATGTLSLKSIFTNGNLLNVNGSTTCTTGTLKWTAKFI